MNIKTTNLIRTSQSWDGAPLPDFPQGKPELQHYNVYRKLKSSGSDKAMIAVLGKRSGANSGIEKNNLLRRLVLLKKQDAHFTLGLIADQKPTPRNAHYWTTFLNQETSFLDGGEMITEQFARRLEANIIEQPQQWLWSHNRWKWNRNSK